MADVTALIVNFNTARYCRACVASLREQHFTVDGRPGELEILVLDNGSRPADREELGRLTEPGVAVHFLGENRGYGAANNYGAARARGRYLFVLNPDVRVLPGALAALVEALAAERRLAAVGPRTWMDDARTLLHPPNDVPRLWHRTLQAAANLSPFWGRMSARVRTRRALRHWRVSEPRTVPLLSGAAFLTRRDVVERVGLFDPAFPLYFEDTDWFVRVRRAGYRLLYVPRAEVVHYFSRSALQDYAAAMAKARRAELYYYRKHYGWWAAAWVARLNRVVARALARRPEGVRLGPCEDLGRVTGPPSFSVSARGPLLGELAGNPLFSLAAGTLVEGGTWRLSQEMWDQLWDGVYFCRLVDPRTLKTLGCWSFRKTTCTQQTVGNAL